MKRDQRKAARARKEVETKRIDWGRFAVHAPVLAVLLVALAAYSISFHAPMITAQAETAVQDSRVHANTAGNWSRIFAEPESQTVLTNRYRPLTTWSYLLNYAILGSGVETFSYHWLNFLLHAANILLVYFLALALFEDRTAALAASALWGLHPVLVEAVTNLAGRAELLAACGVLGAVLSYRAAVATAGTRRVVWVAGVFFAAGVAVFSKESGVVVLAVIALYDQLCLRDRPSQPRIVAFAAATIPVAAFLAVRALVLSRYPAGTIPFVDNPLSGATFWTARITAFHVIAKYVGLLLWPARLSADYSYNAIPVAIDAKGIAGLVLCAGAFGLAWWAWRRHKPLSFGIALFLIALAPVANIFFLTGNSMAERFLYLPAAGFAIAAAAAFSLAAARWPDARKAVAAIVCVAILAFAARAYVRNDDWSAPGRLWASVIDAEPGSYLGHIQYAATLSPIKAVDRNRIVAEIGRTLAILDPLAPAQNAPAAYRTAGAVLRQMGDEVALHRADPDGTQPNDWYQRAMAVLERSEGMERVRDEALVAVNQRRGTPRSTFLPSSIYFEIGRTYLRQAQQLQALSFYEKGRGLEPNADLLEDEAATLASYSDFRKAAQLYIEAIEVDGSRTDLGERIVEMYTKLDPKGCASVNGSLNVKCPMVHDDICTGAQNVAATLARRGLAEDSAAVGRTAIIDLGCTAPAR